MKKNKVYPWYLMIGALVFYFILFLLPSLIGLGYSLTDWSSYSDKINFIGLSNYRTIFSSDSNYLFYIGNTIWFTIATTIGKTGLGLLLALLLKNTHVKGKGFHRSIVYLPSVISILVVSIVFKSILNPSNGFFNESLRALGLDSLTRDWLFDPSLAMWSAIGVDIWRGTGYIMTILLAGLYAINPVYYEAAKIDGATDWQRFLHITLPLLKPSLMVTIVLNVLYGLKVFDIIYSLTGGGPGRRTEVMYTAVFKEFSLGRYGVGTALSSVMFVFMTIIGIVMIRFITKDEVEE